MTSGSTQFRRHALRYFATVAEEGQFSRAAEKLHIAQPALSQAIARLESDLGFRLLDRHARGVTLTPAGELFLEKAREALAAEDDALATAGSLARSREGLVAFGYLGLPPTLTHPGLMEAFAKARPEAEVRAQELPFPTVPTASWLREVDAAIATRPTADPEVRMQPLSAEPRVVVAPKDHRFADRGDLSVLEVLDETFIGFDPSVDPAWAGFWSLDDHRGGPAPHVVGHAITAQERFAYLLAGSGIAVVPACHAAVLINVLQNTVAIPLTDAAPAILTLVARNDRQNTLVEALFATARETTTGDEPL